MAASGEDDLCPLTDLPRYSCGHCTGADLHARERVQVGRIITRTARYPGRCDYCGDPIRPGDRIRSDGGIWIHASHGPDVSPITMTALLPGRCGYCDGPIYPGDRIRADPDGGSSWVHARHDLDV